MTGRAFQPGASVMAFQPLLTWTPCTAPRTSKGQDLSPSLIAETKSTIPIKRRVCAVN